MVEFPRKLFFFLWPCLLRVAHYCRAWSPNPQGLKMHRCADKRSISRIAVVMRGRISQKVWLLLWPLLPRVAHDIKASSPRQKSNLLGSSTTKCEKQMPRVREWFHPNINIDGRISQKVRLLLRPLLPRVVGVLTASSPQQKFNFLGHSTRKNKKR